MCPAGVPEGNLFSFCYTTGLLNNLAADYSFRLRCASFPVNSKTITFGRRSLFMKAAVFCFFTFAFLPVVAQQEYWQQRLRYTITAKLDVRERAIHGDEFIMYHNQSPDTLHYIWFHIWPNAYTNDTTALMKQLREDKSIGKTKNIGYGSVDSLSFSVNGEPARTENHPVPHYVDILKVVLNSPLPPGDSVGIHTPFRVKLPPYFSRSGFAKGEFIACQWYPKPAVYDSKGWHEFPYLDRGEFYSEYGDFDVRITVPSEYIVAATGTLTTTEERDAYVRSGRINAASRKGKWAMYESPYAKGTTKTLQYEATMVPDFAWFADTDFVIQYDTIGLPGGRIVDAFTYFHNKSKTVWANSIDYVEDAVRKYSAWIGEYEYPVVQAVEGPKNKTSGGMEYPMVTLITKPGADGEALDAVITHEVGHNWFMSMLGSNERAHTWMDEGLNTYYQFRYEAEKYRGNAIFGKQIPREVKQLPVAQFLELVYANIANIPMASPMDIPADKFPSETEYGLVSYVKTAWWLYLLEAAVGAERVDEAMRHYFSKWKHKHPGPSDLQVAFEEVLKIDLREYFDLTRQPGRFGPRLSKPR